MHLMVMTFSILTSAGTKLSQFIGSSNGAIRVPVDA